MILPKVVKWWVLQALRGHTQQHQAWRKLIRHSHKHNRIWWITLPKILSKSTWRKWNDIPAFDTVERNSVDWKISKRLTAFVRHREFDGEIDGAVHWSSLRPKLRSDFESEGARTFSDSRWLGNIHRSNKLRFQYCVDSNLACSCHPWSVGRRVLLLDSWNHVAMPLRCKDFPRRTHRWFTSDDRRILWLVKARNVARNRWKVSQAVYWVNLEHKRKGYNSGRDDFMPDCIEKVQETKLCVKEFVRHDQCRKSCWIGARQTIQRAIVCRGRPL